MKHATESSLGRAYRKLYEALCGRHPLLRPWHFQWLPAYFLNRAMSRWLPGLEGTVLDVGCGKKPYKPLFAAVHSYIGVDLSTSSEADVMGALDQGLPFQEGAFDIVILAQVMEYIAEPRLAIAEIKRVLKPGGVAIISFPFILNEHGEHDVTRLSGHMASQMLEGFHMRALERQGGAGSTLTILMLNWLDLSLNRTFLLRLTRPLLLPFWLPLCFVLNIGALLWDRMDVTEVFYSNVFLVLEKQGEGGLDSMGAET